MNLNADDSSCSVVDLGSVRYADAYAIQRETVTGIQRGRGKEVLYLLEHPHVITKGRNSGSAAILADRSTLARRGVTVADTERGGDVTYHGPGQLVGYPILQLRRGKRSIRGYVHDLEEVLIRTLADFGVGSGRHPEYVGVWSDGQKLASIGIRISRWVTFHGFALNVSTDLSFFSLINPCGILGCKMTSMERILGVKPDMNEVKEKVSFNFSEVFERKIVFEKPAPFERLAKNPGPDGKNPHKETAR